MTPENPRLLSLVSEAIEGRYSRREIVRRGVALGLAAPAIGAALSRVSAASVAAQDGPVQVSIVNKEMTPDEIVAAIKSEGEVNVGNWTYTANDTVVAKFQEYVSSTYGVDITLNYEASQAPSTYITSLYTALQSGNPPSLRRDGDRGELSGRRRCRSRNRCARSSSRPDLVPNADRVLEMFQALPTAMASRPLPPQASSTTRSGRRTWRTGQDLADERLQGRLTDAAPRRHHLWRHAARASRRLSVSTTK